MAQIMIVEDSQGTNKAICEYMKSAGHTLIPAFDGAEALNIFRDRKIDLIVLDIMLPKISGLAVLHEIRKSSNRAGPHTEHPYRRCGRTGHYNRR